MFRIIPLFALLCLVGCGPVYQTTYDYIPPSNPEDKLQLNECLHGRQQCRQSCQSMRLQCENNEALKEVATKVVDAIKKGDKTSSFSSSHYHCTASENNCLADCDNSYRACYENCGGTVIQHTECVARCPR